MIGGHSLNPITKDIYFLIVLSRRGELVNLHTFPSGPFNIVKYIRMHCDPDIEKVGSHVPIHNVISLG
jgi:hypothetical protein